MAKSDVESIAATLKRASEERDDTGGASSPLPQLFSPFPIPPGDEVVDNVPQPNADGRQIPGVPAYDMHSHLRRFIIGQQQIGVDQRGQPEYEERDDSAEYENLINDILGGKGALRWEEKQHLRDGTLVISVCYFTVKEKKKAVDGEKNDPLYDQKS